LQFHRSCRRTFLRIQQNNKSNCLKHDIHTHIRSAGISPGCLVSPEENHMDPFPQVASASCSCVFAASAAREESWASWQGSGTRDSNKYEHMMFKHIIMLNSYDIMWYDIVWCTSLYIYIYTHIYTHLVAIIWGNIHHVVMKCNEYEVILGDNNMQPPLFTKRFGDMTSLKSSVLWWLHHTWI
jgi:hypothetical protein